MAIVTRHATQANVILMAAIVIQIKPIETTCTTVLGWLS